MTKSSGRRYSRWFPLPEKILQINPPSDDFAVQCKHAFSGARPRMPYSAVFVRFAEILGTVLATVLKL